MITLYSLDTEPEPKRDHVVRDRDFFRSEVSCPDTPDDWHAPQWGRCQVCGVSLKDRCVPEGEERET